jgi:hypothetical protein
MDIRGMLAGAADSNIKKKLQSVNDIKQWLAGGGEPDTSEDASTMIHGLCAAAQDKSAKPSFVAMECLHLIINTVAECGALDGHFSAAIQSLGPVILNSVMENAGDAKQATRDECVGILRDLSVLCADILDSDASYGEHGTHSGLMSSLNMIEKLRASKFAASKNWRVRETGLRVLSGVFADIKEADAPVVNTLASPSHLKGCLQLAAPFLEDPQPKVRDAAMSVLASLHGKVQLNFSVPAFLDELSKVKTVRPGQLKTLSERLGGGSSGSSGSSGANHSRTSSSAGRSPAAADHRRTSSSFLSSDGESVASEELPSPPQQQQQRRRKTAADKKHRDGPLSTAAAPSPMASSSGGLHTPGGPPAHTSNAAQLDIVPVEPVHIYSEKELVNELSTLASTFGDILAWENRVKGMRRLRSFIVAGVCDMPQVPPSLPFPPSSFHPLSLSI